MQIKIIVRDHLTLVIIAIKKFTNWGLVVRILGFLFFFFGFWAFNCMAWVQSLIRELRSCKPSCEPKKKKSILTLKA